jgi:hypothetical protein
MQTASLLRRHRLERSLREALHRLESARHSKEPADSFAALSEVLKHVVLLDKWHANVVGNNYGTLRDSSQVGMSILGLYHARNLLEHDQQLADLVDVTEGLQFPIQFPFSFHEITWKPIAALPKTTRKKEERLQKAYAQNLQNKPVRLTLLAVSDFLMRL